MGPRSPLRMFGLVLVGSSMITVSAALGAQSAPASQIPPATPVLVSSGEFHWPAMDELSLADEQAIQAEIARNQQMLLRQGRLALPAAATTVTLAWPLRPEPTYTGYGYHAVSTFVDHDLNYPNQVRDYTNGRRSSDSNSGYNHSGTDYFLWPFGWRMMDAEVVAVVAAADGVIVGKSDGNPDRNCGASATGWNAVYVQHADGRIAWYGHLKQNSLTSKGIGDAVVTGEYLGRVGSSGNSSGPHLHFELRSGSGPDSYVVDPYYGPGNNALPASLWQQQPGYYDSAVVRLSTGAGLPDFGVCPQPGEPNEQQSFAPGSTTYLAAYYRDQLAGQVSHLRVLQPDGVEYVTWNSESATPHYAASMWAWMVPIPAHGPTGAWRFELTFEGKVYEQIFFVGVQPPPTSTATATATATIAAPPTPTASATATGAGTIPPTAAATPTGAATYTPTPSPTRTPTPQPDGSGEPTPLAVTEQIFLPFVAIDD